MLWFAFQRDRTGYARLDKMADLEKRLVRKLGRSEHDVGSSVQTNDWTRLFHTGWYIDIRWW
jgi:hypothetical protein